MDDGVLPSVGSLGVPGSSVNNTDSGFVGDRGSCVVLLPG